MRKAIVLLAIASTVNLQVNAVKGTSTHNIQIFSGGVSSYTPSKTFFSNSSGKKITKYFVAQRFSATYHKYTKGKIAGKIAANYDLTAMINGKMRSLNTEYDPTTIYRAPFSLTYPKRAKAIRLGENVKIKAVCIEKKDDDTEIYHVVLSINDSNYGTKPVVIALSETVPILKKKKKKKTAESYII